MATRKPTSVNLDPNLVALMDKAIMIRQLGGEKNVTRSRLITEALVSYLDDFRDTLITQMENVAEQLSKFQHDLENNEFDLIK